MTGTDKQIAYAQDLATTAAQTLRDAANTQLATAPDNETTRTGYARIIAAADALTSYDGYAGHVIELLKDARHTGNDMRDAMQIISIIRSTRVAPAATGALGAQLLEIFA